MVSVSGSGRWLLWLFWLTVLPRQSIEKFSMLLLMLTPWQVNDSLTLSTVRRKPKSNPHVRKEGTYRKIFSQIIDILLYRDLGKFISRLRTYEDQRQFDEKDNDQKWIVHISSCATCFNQLSLNSLYDTQSSLTAVPAIFPHSLWLKAYNGAVNLKRDVSIYPKSSPITRGHIVTRLNTRCFLFCSARDEDSCMTVRLLRFFSSVKIANQHLIPSSLPL